jgi:acyl phosphate:glycerol-3-phosphate acyltransferase
MNPVLAAALGALTGYLLGGIPTGLIVGRLAGVGDIREFGSGKTGFTNALRTLGRKWAASVVVGDVLKGVAAVLIGRFVLGDAGAAALAGSFAVIGHVFPVFAGFRGGRGVSTAFGAFLAVSPLVALGVFAAGLAVLAIWRYASLMSVVGVFAGAVVIGIMTLAGWPASLNVAYLLLFALPTATLVELAHLGNIRRLLSGTEPKLGQGGQRRAAGLS